MLGRRQNKIYKKLVRMNDGEKTKRKSLKIFHGIKKQRNIIYFSKIISNSASGIYIFHYIWERHGRTHSPLRSDRYSRSRVVNVKFVHDRVRSSAGSNEFKVASSLHSMVQLMK